MKISKYRMRLLRILVPAALSLWTVLLPADVQERLSLGEAERVALDNDPRYVPDRRVPRPWWPLFLYQPSTTFVPGNDAGKTLVEPPSIFNER